MNVQDAFWALSVLLSDKKHAMHGICFNDVCLALAAANVVDGAWQ